MKTPKPLDIARGLGLFTSNLVEPLRIKSQKIRNIFEKRLDKWGYIWYLNKAVAKRKAMWPSSSVG